MMDDVVVDEEFLAHYASKYYDPVKAKEYYERTKKLKGRQPALSNTQKEAWGYANKQITEQRNKAKETAANDQKAKLEKIRANAEASKTRILDALKARIADITKTTPIPANASPKVRAFLTKQNAQRRQRAGREAQEELARMGRDLRTAIQSARDSYSGTQKRLSDQYEADRVTERENIRKNIK